MAAWTHSEAVMMAKEALERLMSRPVQFAFFIHEKGTASRGIFLVSEPDLTAFEGRGQHAEGEVRRHLQHHALRVASFDRRGRFLNGPPAGPPAIALTDITGTGRRGRVFRGETRLTFASAVRHKLFTFKRMRSSISMYLQDCVAPAATSLFRPACRPVGQSPHPCARRHR